MDSNKATRIAPGYYSYRGYTVAFIAGRGWAVQADGEIAPTDIVATLRYAKESIDYVIAHPEEYVG